MVFSTLGVLWSCPDLEVVLWVDIWDRSIGVKLYGSFLEVLLHHIEKLVVVLDFDSRVFDDEAPIFMQGVGNYLTLLIGGWRFGQIAFDVDDRQVDFGAETGQLP